MKSDNNSVQIFSLALGLDEPWFVEGVSFVEVSETSSKELHIRINFRKGHEFTFDDGRIGKGYDTEEKTWRHLDFFQHKCYLTSRVPRVELPDGKVRQVSVPWARSGSGFTLLFEAYAMLLIEGEMPVSKVADRVHVTSPRLWRVFDYWVERAKSKDDLSNVCEVGIDETSTKKGHNYVTTFVDMQQHRVIDASTQLSNHVQPGKDSATITGFVEQLELKGGDRKQVEQVCIDMSPAYISGTLEMFQNSQITFDKFHIIQHLNQAMDEVRKKERVGNELIKNHKYTFLKANKKLSDKKRNELEHITMLYPHLGEAYRLKEMFLDVFDIQDKDLSMGYMKFWCDLAVESAIQPFIKFVNLIKTHWFGIVNYFESRLTNGILEGINSKIQLAKRRARGFRKTTNFINMIFFTCGKLKFDYPYKTL
jgi:transposase